MPERLKTDMKFASQYLVSESSSSVRNLENFAGNYLDKIKKGESPLSPVFVVPGLDNKKIIVKFCFYAGSYITNGVWIYNGNKETSYCQ